MRAYRMEVRFTVIMTLLMVAAGNVALFFSIFPVQGMLFGFPIMYIIPILSGWFGILFLAVLANHFGNKIDAEIEKANEEEIEELEQRSEGMGEMEDGRDCMAVK
ncbi:hypothetical protein [Alkalicoccus luteus]|uniref:hypothetical protein n=1 Tax=Alkalicoccus luteus TaxID=1237094 RepID=UPI004033F877